MGYEDNYLPFCAQDADSGELTGALKEFLALSSHAIQNAEIQFKALACPNVQDALEALKKGEIDCVFPVNLSTYDGERLGILMTLPQMQTEIYVSVRSANQHEFSLEDDVTVALDAGDFNYRAFLMDYFPNWKYLYLDSKEDCCQAVAAGKADCVLTSNYRLNLNADLFEKYKLSTVATGKTVNFSFAVRKADIHLYTILNKTTHFVRDSLGSFQN